MTTRWLRPLTPTGFVLAGLCFALPFATVSCDAPGGYGRSAGGGTTTYTGVDLAVGGRPTVDPEHLRPPAEQREDRLPPQPLAIASILLIAAGVGSAAIRETQVRRAVATSAAAVAAMFLVANQSTVETLIAERLRGQLAAELPAGKEPADYVHTNPGMLICLLLLIVLTAGNLVAWIVANRRTRVGHETVADRVINVAGT